ncbi:Neprosin activation peptide [Arabidopsis suecica]|uniref:Neprosin activation peptide n=1 Tax=Arabidopsis suecica TaxID=45249 RepID=A0A8T1YLK3_ARASU|nr:Neprosin activation peptide [Arabidopsis suecica]
MASYWLLYLFIYLFSYHIAQTVQKDIEYECVDIYKQPAFQHPLMKDHQIQMRPSVEFQAMVSTEPETSDLFTGESEEREKDVISSIQFGWAVHTGLYRDDRPRLTTYWISGRHPNGCYNALCRGGYVQVHKTIYPGMVYNKVSTLGKRQSTAHLLVGQDSRTKNWLLMTRSTLIGYWPYQIYSMQGASQVLFGGYTGGLAGATSPPMGAGTFPKEVGYRNKFSCFMKQLKCFEDKRLVDIDSNEFEEYVDSPKCYDVWFRKFEIGKGEMLTFGGPGGECGI